MRIVKRDGTTQPFMPNKLLKRIKEQSTDLKVDPDILFQMIVPLITDNMTTIEIDELTAFKAADNIIRHPDYALLGGRILMTRQSKLVNKPILPVDLTYDFFAATTFLAKYSKRNGSTPIELPSDMYKRCSDHLSNSESDATILLDELNSKKINFASPIYTNSNIVGRGSMISCTLMSLSEDTIEGIEETLTKIAYASKDGSGIGLLIDALRSCKSMVSSFNSNAGGVVRLADMVQSKMRFYKQGSRSGSCALYMSVFHKDIISFLELTLPIGDEQMRTRDLFTGVVINDLFMQKLIDDEDWYLFCPNDIKKAGLRPLYDLYGAEFEAEYYKAVELGIGERISPKTILDAIIKSQAESGRPYVMFKENANIRNMQDNIGPITMSNLCVAPNTKILTDNGDVEIQTLKNRTVKVWNGEEFTKVTVRQTGYSQRLLRVTMTNGLRLDCTPYHKFYIRNNDNENQFAIIEAKKLISGDKTIKFKLPISHYLSLSENDRDAYMSRYGGMRFDEVGDMKVFSTSLTVASIEKLPNVYDTYCFTEPKRSMGVFNGILTGQCIEVMEVSKPKYTAQCTLASINLSAHDNLETIATSTKVLVRALNCVIDKNKWSDEWSKAAGEDQRALAIGVAGMADFFAKKKISFESQEAKDWNAAILETMYKAAVEESNRLAELYGKTYPAWEGSRYSRGETYIEGWSPLPEGVPIKLLNSLFIGLMPTASSAILLGCYESFEPVTSNLFNRRVGQGEFIVINKYLVNELIELKLWNASIQNQLIQNGGSVQTMLEIPEDIRYRYKDVWEIPQKTLLDLAIIRNKFVDQSQSLNMYHTDAKYSKISSALMYAWKGGLKTGVYYTRTKSKQSANSKLASSHIISTSPSIPEKPKDSPFECYGCEA